MSSIASLSRPSSPLASSAAADLVRHDDSRLGSEEGGGYAVGYVSAGSTTPSISHSLDTQDIFVVVRDATTGWTPVMFRPTSNSAVQLTFATAPTTNQYRYMLIASAPSGVGQEGTPPTTDASELTSGILDPRRLPRITSFISPGTVSTNITTDASVVGNLLNGTVTGSSITVAEPTNGVDRQVIRYAFYATLNTTVTFNSAIRLSTGLTSRAFVVPSGQVLLAAVEYLDFIDSWVLTAATVSAT